MTGDDRYLKGRSASVVSAREAAARIATIEASSALRQRLDRLVALAERRVRYSDLLITQRASPAEAVKSIRAASDLMDEIRSEAETIVTAETAAYRAEQSRLESQAWITSIALAVGVVLCLGAIAWLFALRGREVERRRQLEEDLRALNIELDQRVAERTAELRESREHRDPLGGEALRR